MSTRLAEEILAVNPVDRLTRDRAYLVLAGICGLGLWLRTLGLGFGLPAVYNPDEVAIMSRSLAFATGDLNPHNFLYPTFYFYVLFGWLGGFFAAGWVAGVFDSVAAFQRQFFVDPSIVYLGGRWLTALLGVAAIGATYVLGSRLFDRLTGLAAALCVAISPVHVRDSHYVKHDVPASLAVVLAYLALDRLWFRSPTRSAERDLLVAGLACGAAFAVHYYTVFLLLPLLVGVWIRDRDQGWWKTIRDMAAAGLASLASFCLLSPFILVEPATAWRDVTANRRIVVDRAREGRDALFGFLASAESYAGLLWSDAVGWPMLLLAGVGTAVLVKRARRKALFLWLFPATFLLFIANTVAASRYLNPAIPFIAVLAAYGVRAMTTPRRTIRLSALVIVLAATPGFLASLQGSLFFRQTDTRTLARRYIEAHIAPGSTVLVQPYSVPLVQSHDSLREALVHNLGDTRRASTKFVLQLALDPYPEPAYRTIFLGDGGLDADKIYVGYDALGGPEGLEALRRLEVQYVVLTRYNKPAVSTRPFLDALERGGRRVAVFAPYRQGVGPDQAATVAPFLHNTSARVVDELERPGPVIEVWRLP